MPLQVLDQAKGVVESKSVSVLLVALIFSGITFVLASVLIFIKEFLSEKVYTIAQCEQNNDLILGLIPNVKEKGII